MEDKVVPDVGLNVVSSTGNANVDARLLIALPA